MPGRALNSLGRTGPRKSEPERGTLIGLSSSAAAPQFSGRWNFGVGLVNSQTIGRAGVHTINEGHVSVAPLRVLLDPISTLTDRVREAVGHGVTPSSSSGPSHGVRPTCTATSTSLSWISQRLSCRNGTAGIAGRRWSTWRQYQEARRRRTGAIADARGDLSTAAKYSNGAVARCSSARLLRAQRASARFSESNAVTLQARG